MGLNVRSRAEPHRVQRGTSAKLIRHWILAEEINSRISKWRYGATLLLMQIACGARISVDFIVKGIIQVIVFS